jgi:hypothetical protein
MDQSLNEVLDLVGPLDDKQGESTARERFRGYLGNSIKTAGLLHDYIETSLRTSGPQYNRALQDLVNYCGKLLGFAVEFGRYQGIKSETGHDGLWESASHYYVVVEVKTTDAYAITTDTLLNYVDRLISAKRIPDWDHAIGLYIVARADSRLNQITNAIMAERRTHQLRIISAEKLISLVELMESYDMTHSDILHLLKPQGPVIDQMVELASRIASSRPTRAFA